MLPPIFRQPCPPSFDAARPQPFLLACASRAAGFYFATTFLWHSRLSDARGLIVLKAVYIVVTGVVAAMLLPLSASANSGGQDKPVHNAAATAPMVGRNAPDFQLPTLHADAQQRRLLSLSAYRGKVVYLDFWDSWCKPCRELLPRLDSLRDSFSRADFEVVAVNLDVLPQEGLRFLERYPVAYPVVSDPARSAAGEYALQHLPTAFLLDRHGVIRHVSHANDVRSIDRYMDATKTRLSALIAEPAPRQAHTRYGSFGGSS